MGEPVRNKGGWWNSTGERKVDYSYAEGLRDPTPAPGAGLWDDEPVKLPDVWSFKTPNKQVGYTIDMAMNHWGSAQKSAATYPYSRLALWLQNNWKLPGSKLLAWYKGPRLSTGGGPGSQELVYGAILDGEYEFREHNGLIYVRKMPGNCAPWERKDEEL